MVHGLNGGDAFFNRMGATVCERTFCGEGSGTAWLSRSERGRFYPESYIHSKYIVIWACNSVSTNFHHWAIVKDAQKRGAKVVVIDAYASRTAKEADGLSVLSPARTAPSPWRSSIPSLRKAWSIRTTRRK